MSNSGAVPKSVMRNEIRRRRRQRLATGEAERASAAIVDHLGPVLAGARAVLAYACLPGEPDIDAALDTARGGGVQVLLPCSVPGQALRFGELTGPIGELPGRGRWKIREPEPDFSAAEAVRGRSGPGAGGEGDVGAGGDDGDGGGAGGGGVSELDDEGAAVVLLVPLLGVSADGARLGNGGGFYDRTFGPEGILPVGSRAGIRVIGVCFDEERELTGLVGRPWDLRVPEVVTETGLHSLPTE